jgi:hypothetical protein
MFFAQPSKEERSDKVYTTKVNYLSITPKPL